MAIVLKDKSIFIHTPRTAGTWISEYFTRHDLVDEVSSQIPIHSSFTQAKSICEKNGIVIKKVFTGVRHPVEWYRSHWAFSMDYQLRNFVGDPERDKLFEFESFVKILTSRGPDYIYNKYFKDLPEYTDFLKHEDFPNCFIDYLKAAGLPLDQSYVENSPARKKCYRSKPAVSDEIRDMIIGSEKTTMQRFYE